MLVTALSACGASFSARRQLARSRSAKMAATAADLTFPDWPAKFDNSLLRELRAEPSDRPPHQSRQVHGAHYTRVRPTVDASDPVLVAHSEEVAADLGMSAADVESEAFLKMFSGSPPAGHECWATAYGAGFAGQYGGQRGDGRAISLGQTGEFELQLKGAGTTPYSRQFDGRAVLRSCVREFLASEAMAALRVPTTRCLCVVTTGDGVVRQWYANDERARERVLQEPGAVGTRVARSYLRFGQMELFTQRGELPLLQELAEHALRREFSHLLVQHPSEARSKTFVRMFREVCERQAPPSRPCSTAPSPSRSTSASISCTITSSTATPPCLHHPAPLRRLALLHGRRA